MNDTTQNFFNAFALLNPPKIIEREYRLYYNEESEIIRASEIKNESYSEPFLIVTKKIYENFRCYEIKDGKLVKRGIRRVPQLSDKGHRVAYGHSALLLENNEKVKEQHYEW